MSEEKLFTAKEVKYWIDAVSTIEKHNQWLLTDVVKREKDVNDMQASLKKWRKWRNRGLLILLSSFGFVFILLGVIATDEKLTAIFLNFGAGMLGAAVGFLFINQLWQSGENNYHYLMDMNQQMDRYVTELRKYQNETEGIKQGLSNMFRTIDETPENFHQLGENLEKFQNHSIQMLATHQELGEKFITLVSRIEGLSKADKELYKERANQIKGREPYAMSPPNSTPNSAKDV